MWLSNHASQEFIQSYISDRLSDVPKPKTPDKEIQSNWTALAKMQGDFSNA